MAHLCRRARVKHTSSVNRSISILREAGLIVHTHTAEGNEQFYRLTDAGWAASGVGRPMGV